MSHAARPAVLALSALTAAFAVLAAPPCAAARADEVLLTNGGKLEGKATRVGDRVVVETTGGTMRLDAKEVKSITVAPTKDDLYRERVAAAAPKDAAGHLAMADWCKSQGLGALETKHLRTVVELDPDHEAARARLGYVRYDGRWLTDDEYHRARGFVKVAGEWVSADEIVRRESERRAAEAMQTHVRKIRNAVAKMSSPRRKVRLDGKVSLQEYAEKIGDASLGQFAADVAGYYNASWRAIRDEWEGASTATVEVRATSATLKRPIPVIETSLGGFSTPVRIQLPEMSIVSVRTTARVPITIELDDE